MEVDTEQPKKEPPPSNKRFAVTIVRAATKKNVFSSLFRWCLARGSNGFQEDSWRGNQENTYDMPVHKNVAGLREPYIQQSSRKPHNVQTFNYPPCNWAARCDCAADGPGNTSATPAMDHGPTVSITMVGWRMASGGRTHGLSMLHVDTTMLR